jgi:hypothetical protein
MHKYFKMRLEKGDLVPRSQTQSDDEDADVDAFADELFENELRKTDGAVDVDDDDDDDFDEGLLLSDCSE